MTDDDRGFTYDSIAGRYADGVDSAPFNALYERPCMLGMLPPVGGERILDAGCGSGWYAEQLALRGAVVDAVDSSGAMVEQARERLRALPPQQHERITLHMAALGEHLPFDDSTFAGVVSPLVLHYLRDWRPALAEIRRVLRPGGWLLFSTHHPAADAERFGTQNYFATERVTDTWEWVGEVSFYRRSLTEIVASLTESGFTIRSMVEPQPVDAFRETDPAGYERLMRRPEFLIVLSETG